VLAQASRLVTPKTLDGEAPPPEGRPVADRLHARYFAVVWVSTDPMGVTVARMQAWDYQSGAKMPDERFTVDEGWRNTYDAADRLQSWLSSPQAVREAMAKSESKPIEVPAVLKNKWFWVAAGGVALAAGGTYLIASHHGQNGFVLGVP
jgi:hypothetical protein